MSCLGRILEGDLDSGLEWTGVAGRRRGGGGAVEWSHLPRLSVATCMVMWPRLWVCGHVYIYVAMCIWPRVWVCGDVCVYVSMCIWPRVWEYGHVCVCGHVDGYVATYMCMWPRVWVCGHVYGYVYVALPFLPPVTPSPRPARHSNKV